MCLVGTHTEALDEWTIASKIQLETKATPNVRLLSGGGGEGEAEVLSLSL